MEVPFKVYTFWNASDKPEVRRFGITKSSVDSFFFLSQKLLEVYPGLKDKNYTVSWKDEDGDDVVISSDMELKTALQFTNYENIKLYINCKGEAKKDNTNIFAANTAPRCSTGIPLALHLGVVCDSCDTAIVGFRYKCTVCDDFDLCSKCEAAGCHPEHCMVRVPTPTMPRTLIKAAIKRSRHFLKSVSTNVGEECPYMKRRRDKSGERKHRGHHGGHHGPHGPHGPHGSHGPHGGDSHRRPRSSWLETFATYMNEFANLAGDIDLTNDHAPETKPAEQKAGTSQEQTKTTDKETTETPKEQEPNRPENAQAECPIIPPVLNVENIKGLLQMFLQDMHSSTAPKDNDVEMGQGDRKTLEADNITVNSETSMKSATSAKAGSTSTEESVDSSINTDFYKDASPEKVDDWTMINKEKDLMDAGVAIGSNEAVPPIGFNLPEEFRERVKINDGASLYPPLNSSTAVLNPKVAETAPTAPTAPQAEGAAAAPAPAPPATPPQQAPQAKPQEPKNRHPKPHIDAAIEQMTKMGFSNDGDWLTQLLEYTDGNIAAVLDLLTPVNPKNPKK